jgi:hypothetical protein
MSLTGWTTGLGAGLFGMGIAEPPKVTRIPSVGSCPTGFQHRVGGPAVTRHGSAIAAVLRKSRGPVGAVQTCGTSTFQLAGARKERFPNVRVTSAARVGDGVAVGDGDGVSDGLGEGVVEQADSPTMSPANRIDVRMRIGYLCPSDGERVVAVSAVEPRSVSGVCFVRGPSAERQRAS